MSAIFDALKGQGDLDTSTLRAFATALYHYLELAVKHHRPRVVWALLAMFPHLKQLPCETEIRETYTLFQYSVWCALKPNIFGRGVTDDHTNLDKPHDDTMSVVVQLLDRNRNRNRNRNSRINEQHPVSGNTVLHMLLEPLDDIVRWGCTDWWQRLTKLPLLLTWAMSRGADPTIANAKNVTACVISQRLWEHLNTNAEQPSHYTSLNHTIRYKMMRPMYLTIMQGSLHLCSGTSKGASKAKRRRSDKGPGTEPRNA